MAARHVLLLAFGEGKAEAVAHLVEGSISARWPATVLQAHPRVTIFVDESAGSRLALAEDYRAAWTHGLDGRPRLSGSLAIGRGHVLWDA